MMEVPLIDAARHLALMAVLFLIVSAAYFLSHVAQRGWVSPPPIVILVALLLPNLGIVPFKAPAYEFVTGYFLILAVPLLLLDADLRKIVTLTGPVLLAFAIGAVASIIGCFVAIAVAPVGDFKAEIITLYSTVVTGGMVNLMSVGAATGIFERNPTLLPAIIGGSIVADLGYLLAINQLASARRLTGVFAERARSQSPPPAEDRAVLDDRAPMPEPLGTGLAFALSLMIAAISVELARWAGRPGFAVVFAGLISVIIATAAPKAVSRLRSLQSFGVFLMLTFLATVCVGADLSSLTGLALGIFVFAVVLYLVHIPLTLLLAFILRLDMPTSLIGSVAGIAGPSVTASIAGAQGWKMLITPGLLCTMLGLAIGNYIGLALYALLTS